MRSTLDLPALTEAQLVLDFLLAEAFTADQLLVACSGAQRVGFVLVPRGDPLGPAASGWIAAFGVLASHRRRGVATRLVEAAIATSRAAGVTRLEVADVPVRYLVPGVDRQACAGAFALLTGRFGFAPRDEVASMGVHLGGLREWGGEDLRFCEPGAYPLLRDFLRREFDPAWWAFYHRSIVARLAGDPTPSEVVCCWRDGCLVGAADFRGDRFGPLAVAAAARGRGIGARLTRATLGAMREAGCVDAHFLIGTEAVQPFYAKLGFRTLRRFTRLTRAL